MGRGGLQEDFQRGVEVDVEADHGIHHRPRSAPDEDVQASGEVQATGQHGLGQLLGMGGQAGGAGASGMTQTLSIGNPNRSIHQSISSTSSTSAATNFQTARPVASSSAIAFGRIRLDAGSAPR